MGERGNQPDFALSTFGFAFSPPSFTSERERIYIIYMGKRGYRPDFALLTFGFSSSSSPPSFPSSVLLSEPSKLYVCVNE